MPLSKESEEIAEIKYDLAVQRIKKKYAAQQQEIDNFFRTATGREPEVLKLLPLRLEETSNALLDCYFERFEADGVIPDQTDLERLDRRIENIFCGGHGDYLGAVNMDTKCEIDGLEREAQKKLKMRRLELKLRKPATATYEMNIDANYGPIQQGPGNTQNIGVQTRGGKPHIKWSQLKPVVGLQRVSEVGDIEVTEANIADAEEIGDDPWVELLEINTFGTKVKKYALGFFTPGS